MENTAQATLQPSSYFASTIYTIEKPEFLDSVGKISDKALKITKDSQEKNEVYPSVMSASMIGTPEIKDFEMFIAQSGWSILEAQGYNMVGYNTFISELWSQEHYKFSSMDTHVHPYGAALSGFYFLEVPDGGCMVQLHDPRPGKVQISLPEADATKVTEASNSFFIKPEPGMFIFSNSWLPHSFTRNTSDKSVKFVHFNISTITVPQKTIPAPVVI